MGKSSLFNKWCWENWTDTCRTPSYTTHKNKFKMSQRRKCSTQNHKNPRENIGSKISDTSHRIIFSDISLQARETKEKQTKGTTSSQKVFAQKKKKKRRKRQSIEWENTFASDTSDRGSISSIATLISSKGSRTYWTSSPPISVWVLPGRSFRAASSANLSRGPEQGHPASTSTPAFFDSRWADRSPPTTTDGTKSKCQNPEDQCFPCAN